MKKGVILVLILCSLFGILILSLNAFAYSGSGSGNSGSSGGSIGSTNSSNSTNNRTGWEKYDVNDDERVDDLDYKTVFNCYLGKCDINNDGNITPGDSLIIANYIESNTQSFVFPSEYDINDDEKINGKDYTGVFNCYLGKCDINRDGQITPGDALLIANYIEKNNNDDNDDNDEQDDIIDVGIGDGPEDDDKDNIKVPSSSGSNSGKTEFKYEEENKYIAENGNEVKYKIKIEVKEENGILERKIKFKSESSNGSKIEIEEEVKIGDDLEGNELELEIENETKNNNTISNKTKIKVKLKNGNSTEIKVLPSVASERAREIFESRNLTIVLKEIEHKNVPRIVYHIESNKTGKFLGIFKMEAKLEGDIDPETGELLVKNIPWWAFLLFGDNSTEPPQNNTGINNTNVNNTNANGTDINNTIINQTQENNTLINNTIVNSTNSSV
ncbi:MAG: dockerin type I domain-containing protein [Nanoarchaeota archaeon]